MAKWNTAQYLKFENERTQPATDLVNRINIENPQRILDIGCGPGNSTRVLFEHFSAAAVTGVDSSTEMIEKARTSYPELSFKVCDAARDLSSLGGDYDVVFSNACIQWIPNHKELIANMFGLLKPTGVLAVQFPMNRDESIHRIIDEVVSQIKWEFNNADVEQSGVLSLSEYYDILSALTDDFCVWETTYYHRMDSCRDLVEWVKGTRLRPYLNVLDDKGKKELEDEIERRAKEEYKPQANGELILRFRRFFFIATRK